MSKLYYDVIILRDALFLALKLVLGQNFQKQPSDVFYKKRCSLKFRKLHRKTPVPESLF